MDTAFIEEYSGKAAVWMVVPVFEGGDAAREFVRQVREQDYENWQLVITDHGERETDFGLSGDQRVVILRGSSDMWWTGATNMSLRYAWNNGEDSDKIVIINYDVRIGKDYLSNLLKAVEGRDNLFVGSVCGELGSNRIDYAGHKFDWIKAGMVPVLKGEDVSVVKGKEFESDVLSGRGFIGELKDFKRVGEFDERLVHYGADFEYGWRARRMGYELVCNGDCVVYTEGKPGSLYEFKGGVRDFFCDIKKPGNFKVTLFYANLCFGFWYGKYYIAVNFLRMLGSLIKRYILSFKGWFR